MKLSIKANLLVQFLLVGIVPLAIVTAVALYLTQQTLEKSEFRKLGSIRKNRIANLERFLKGTENQVIAISESRSTISAVTMLSREFHRMGAANQFTESEIEQKRQDLTAMYNTQLLKLFKEKNPTKDFPHASSIKSMSNNAVVAQHAYLFKNPHPFGSKANLYKAEDGSEYSHIHGLYHAYYNNLLKRFSFYDLFIIDKSGDIIYTAAKEMDFGTNLMTGPFKDSKLAEAFMKSVNSTNSAYVYMSDLDSYAPSYGSPAGFVTSPIVQNGKTIGVLAAQIHTGVIEDIMNERYGMGETGEAYLIGKDRLMRSDAHHNKALTLENSFLKPETGRIKGEFIDLAFTGKTGYGYTTNYAGEEVLSTYGPVQHGGIEWALLVEKSSEEAMGGLNHLIYVIGGIAFVTIIVIVLCGLMLGNKISKPILNIAEHLSENSEKVAEASETMQASSQKLSEMAGEQACSIEETAASIEEISAMVKNNVDQAEKSSTLSKQVQDLAGQGNSSMDELIRSMNEIMESNRKIQDLVNVIEEIGDKTEVIDEIVFQTKLLSFNASVEAERAGEHGRGFAVVAQEVGNLAQMSGKAALEIASMVKSSIKNAEEITKEASRKVESGNDLVKETAKFLKSIQGNAEDLSQQAAQIVVSSKEQSDGISQVNEAMSHLDQATQQNSATAEATEVSSKGLAAQAKDLNHNVHDLMEMVYGSSADIDEKMHAHGSHHDDDNVVHIDEFKGDQPSAPSAIPAHNKAASGGDIPINSGGGDDWEKL